MRFRKAGKITDHLWYLGREESGTYYLEGRDGAILINGGLSYILPDVLAQMKAFGLDPARVRKFLILHSHFDHAGIVPYFKRTFPAMEIIASAPAWKIFAMPKAIEIMNSFSATCARQAGAADALQAFDIEWRDDMAGAAVGDGDRIDLGGIALTILETPGHTNCSITAYEPEAKALFASDAAGIPYKDSIFPSMNTNMVQYLESLEKLNPLPVSYHCADHYGYISGGEAGRFISLSMDAGRIWKAALENYHQKYSGDVDAAAKAVTEFFYREMPDYFIAPDILEGVFKQMMKFIGKNR